MDGGWSMDREKGVEYKLLNELFTRMQYEQTVLMFGNKYRKINTSVLDLCVEFSCYNKLRIDFICSAKQ